MELTFLGKETQGGGSPTLYETDHDSYVLQGWKVQGQPTTVVEIPESLLRHLRAGTTLAEPLVPTGRLWRGDSGECPTYTIAGVAITDQRVLAPLGVPSHETCIEVGRRREER